MTHQHGLPRRNLVATYPCGTYVFELKVGGTAAEALGLIRERGYAKPYLAQGLPVWAVGLAFDLETRSSSTPTSIGCGKVDG